MSKGMDNESIEQINGKNTLKCIQQCLLKEENLSIVRDVSLLASHSCVSDAHWLSRIHTPLISYDFVGSPLFGYLHICT